MSAHAYNCLLDLIRLSDSKCEVAVNKVESAFGNLLNNVVVCNCNERFNDAEQFMEVKVPIESMKFMKRSEFDESVLHKIKREHTSHSGVCIFIYNLSLKAGNINLILEKEHQVKVPRY